jgi:hypothetical protein
MFNSTALLGGGINPSSSWDISTAAANALFPSLRLFSAFDAATSFLVWLFSTSFRGRRTPRRGRLAPSVSPTFSPESPESSLEEEEEEDGEDGGGAGEGD